MRNDNSEHYMFTLTAFLLATALIDELSASEQNALGNWFMLIGQTLCTLGSIKFNKEHKHNINAQNLLNKTKNIINQNM